MQYIKFVPALMYLYLLTTDGKRKMFLQQLSKKLLVKFVRKTNSFMDTEKLSI